MSFVLEVQKDIGYINMKSFYLLTMKNKKKSIELLNAEGYL